MREKVCGACARDSKKTPRPRRLRITFTGCRSEEAAIPPGAGKQQLTSANHSLLSGQSNFQNQSTLSKLLFSLTTGRGALRVLSFPSGSLPAVLVVLKTACSQSPEFLRFSGPLFTQNRATRILDNPRPGPIRCARVVLARARIWGNKKPDRIVTGHHLMVPLWQRMGGNEWGKQRSQVFERVHLDEKDSGAGKTGS